MTEKLRVRRCPTCGESKRRILFEQRFESLAKISLLRGYEVVACARCGLVYADRIPPAEAFARYYAEASKYEYSHREGQQDAAEQWRLARLAARIATVTPSSARLLDIGCSTGELLVALRAHGFSDLNGLDPSEACVRYARTKYGITMFNRVLGARPTDIDPFGVIVLSAVLEHVPDLHAFLDFVDQWLTPDGLLIIEVPDAENFANAFNAPYQEFSVEHINFFSAPALDNLLGMHAYSRIAKHQELCNAGGNLTSPVLTGIYCRGAQRKAPLRQSASENGVRAYVKKCEAGIDTEHRVINRLVESQRPVLVWGVGTLCQRLLASTRLTNANIVGFVDSNPHYQGSALVGRPVFAPADVLCRTESILVLSWGFFDDISAQIRNTLALKNEIIRIDNAALDAGAFTTSS